MRGQHVIIGGDDPDIGDRRGIVALVPAGGAIIRTQHSGLILASTCGRMGKVGTGQAAPVAVRRCFHSLNIVEIGVAAVMAALANTLDDGGNAIMDDGHQSAFRGSVIIGVDPVASVHFQ